MAKPITIYIISDSVGETIQKNINAVLAQFNSVTERQVRRFPFVTSEKELANILKDALSEEAIVATTLVSQKLNKQLADFSKETGLQYVDYMSPLTKLISEQIQQEPTENPGAIYQMNERYFKQAEAVEFAVRYDDGKNPKGFSEADLIILGVSRTSKTPLSMYLANKSYKVANLPLIPEVSLPVELTVVPEQKVIGLIGSAEYIEKIRRSRLRSLGLSENVSYVNAERIQEEIDYAKEVYKKLDALVVNIDHKAVEEIASEIEERLD
ncbi:kinase/pyrophosphorylase [Vagococcus coleopterorum]|uniref:Putative pyruvate, phosphate dikinase regulatory protein n=1 Tax=Vagococcus coleopterorum TaxID=2714946 RepID=A0A6G8ALD2_9ENTE|nr:pyruvate, water dikinase regulatory protein [Vagococcus coleopterorum]QIL45868.1 kinase/pyrophosphorylase [Vagococcus coleopterorum]